MAGQHDMLQMWAEMIFAKRCPNASNSQNGTPFAVTITSVSILASPHHYAIADYRIPSVTK